MNLNGNGDGNLSQFVSDSKIVEAHLRMLAKAKIETASQKEAVQKVISLFGPDKQLDVDIAKAIASIDAADAEIIAARVRVETDRLIEEGKRVGNALRVEQEEEDEGKDEAGQFTLSKIDPLLLTLL